MEEEISSLWEADRYRCLRENSSEDNDNYILSKIHNMCNASLNYIQNILQMDETITTEQALTIFEALKYRIKDIFNKDIFIEINILEERIQGKIIYKNMTIFDFPFDSKNQGISEYIEKEKAETRTTVLVPDLEGETEEQDLECMLRNLFGENKNE